MTLLEKKMKEKYTPLVYKDAELRAAAAYKYFKQVLNIEHVEVLRNLSRAEIIVTLCKLNIQAAFFEHSRDYDTQAVNAIFINWIGFKLSPSLHEFVKDFEIDSRIFPPQFQLTKYGEVIAFGEYLKWIAENKKTQVVFFQDVQAETRYEPSSSAYVQQDGFNMYIHFKDKKQNLV